MPVAGLKQVYVEGEDKRGPHRNHPLYDEWHDVWIEIRDSLKGEKAIKARADNYIERPPAFEKKEFAAFAHRAEYPLAAQRTHRGTIDRVFSKPSKREVPPRLNDMLPAIDGHGYTFEDFEKWCFSEACALHRAGLLADWDEVAKKPRLKRYAAERIYDWQFGKDGALVRLVLDEPVTAAEFYADPALPARRVFVVDDKGSCYTVVYQKEKAQGSSSEKWVAGEATEVTAAGKPVTSIPFVFIGSAHPQTSILAPLVSLSRHYLNVSADHRHQLHNSAFIQWWLKQEVTKDMDENITVSDGVDLYGEPVKEDGSLAIEMGSSRVLMLRNASVNVAAPPGNTLTAHKEKLADLKGEMVAYGARIFDQDVRSNVAAETVWIQNSSNATSVASLAEMVSQGIADALGLAAMLMGLGEDAKITVELNKDYFDERFALSDIPQLILGMDEGLFGKKDARQIMRRGGVDMRSDEEIEKDLQMEGFEETDALNDPPGMN